MTSSFRVPITTAPTSAVAVRFERGGLDIIDRYADEWRKLCSNAIHDQPFFRPEWVRAYLRAFVPDAKIIVITAWVSDRLCFVLPLLEERATFSKIPVRRLRAPVDHRGCRFDALRAQGAEGEIAVRAVWEYFANDNDWDLLQFHDTQENSTVASLVEVARTNGFRILQTNERPNPFVPIPATREMLERLPCSSRLRTKLRQVRRELSRQAPLRFYRVESTDSDTLDRLYQLEASGWKGEAGTAILCKPETRRFYNEIAESAAHFGYLCLYMLEWKGELLAAHFSLVYNGHCYSPIVTHNERFRDFAPGHLIVSEILQDCMARGITGYDITGQDQEWKMKWTTEARPVLNHYVFRGGLGKLAYHAGCLLGWRGSTAPRAIPRFRIKALHPSFSSIIHTSVAKRSRTA